MIEINIIWDQNNARMRHELTEIQNPPLFL
jgi:hypothetical protein